MPHVVACDNVLKTCDAEARKPKEWKMFFPFLFLPTLKSCKSRKNKVTNAVKEREASLFLLLSERAFDKKDVSVQSFHNGMCSPVHIPYSQCQCHSRTLLHKHTPSNGRHHHSITILASHDWKHEWKVEEKMHSDELDVTKWCASHKGQCWEELTLFYRFRSSKSSDKRGWRGREIDRESSLMHRGEKEIIIEWCANGRSHPLVCQLSGICIVKKLSCQHVASIHREGEKDDKMQWITKDVRKERKQYCNCPDDGKLSLHWKSLE